MPQKEYGLLRKRLIRGVILISLKNWAVKILGKLPSLQFQMKDIREEVVKIQADQQRWTSLIPQLAVKPVEDQVSSTFWDYFISANEAAVKEWDRQRENEIIASPISPQLVKTFKEQSLEGWNQRNTPPLDLAELQTIVESIAKTDERMQDIGERR